MRVIYLFGESHFSQKMPIDPNFDQNREVSGEENGVKVWGDVNKPSQLGIHGTHVAVAVSYTHLTLPTTPYV